jgi:hypothetical protein
MERSTRKSELELRRQQLRTSNDGGHAIRPERTNRSRQMTDFEKRWGNLTVGEAIALNKAAEESQGDPTIFE